MLLSDGTGCVDRLLHAGHVAMMLCSRKGKTGSGRVVPHKFCVNDVCVGQTKVKAILKKKMLTNCTVQRYPVK